MVALYVLTYVPHISRVTDTFRNANVDSVRLIGRRDMSIDVARQITAGELTVSK